MRHFYPSRPAALLVFVTLIGAATGRPELFHVAPTNETCYDYFRWMTFDGNECSYIQSEIKSMNITDGSRCGYLGYFQDVLNGFSANEGCCICGGGTRNSTLTNQVIRAGIPTSNSSSIFTFYENSTRDADGSIINYFKDFSLSVGLGMQEVKYNGTFDTCIEELQSGNRIDVCIGNFWSTRDRGAVANASLPLYFDYFFLLSGRIKGNTKKVYVWLNVFQPFSWTLWLVFLGCLLFMALGSFLLKIKPHDLRWSRKGMSPFTFWWNSILVGMNALSKSIRNCATGGSDGIDESNLSLPEHVLLLGFILFSVLFLTSYESSYTAGLVNSKHGAEYNSLSGAIGKNVTVCLFPQVNETLQFLYPSLRNILEVNDTTEMVNSIKDGTCKAGILHSLAFETLYYKDKKICDDILASYEEIILSIPNSIFLSRNYSLSREGQELLAGLNLHINSGRYISLYHNYYYNKLSDVEFSLERLAVDDQNHNGITRRNLQILDIQSSNEYVCNVEDVQKSVTLSFTALLFPILLSVLCTIIAVIVWTIRSFFVIKRVKYDKEWQTRLRESRLSIAGGERITSAFVNDEITFHTWEFEEKSVTEAVTDLQKCKVNEALIREALNQLPDRAALCNLYVNEKISLSSRMYRAIYELSICQLCDILGDEEKDIVRNIHYGDIEGDAQKYTNALDEKNPKRLLLENVINSPERRTRALELADNLVVPYFSSIEEEEPHITKEIEKKCLPMIEGDNPKHLLVEKIMSSSKSRSHALQVADDSFLSDMSKDDDSVSVTNSRAHTL